MSQRGVSQERFGPTDADDKRDLAEHQASFLESLACVVLGRRLSP